MIKYNLNVNLFQIFKQGFFSYINFFESHSILKG